MTGKPRFHRSRWKRPAESQDGGKCLEHKDPEKVSLAYTEDSFWRNRSEFIHGQDEILAFLKRK